MHTVMNLLFVGNSVNVQVNTVYVHFRYGECERHIYYCANVTYTTFTYNRIFTLHIVNCTAYIRRARTSDSPGVYC